MDIYTISISQWRKAKERDIELYDITVRSGDAIFAPEPSVLWAYKAGEVEEDEYTRLYYNKLRDASTVSPEAFRSFLERPGPIAVGCYCRAGAYCHRHLFIKFMGHVAKGNGYEFNYLGEIL